MLVRRTQLASCMVIYSPRWKKRAAFQRERDQLWSDLEKTLELVVEDRSKQQRAIDIYKRLKYRQGYEDHEQGKEPRYPLYDDVETALENVEEASGDEMGSGEHEEGEDMKEVEEDEEV